MCQPWLFSKDTSYELSREAYTKKVPTDIPHLTYRIVSSQVSKLMNSEEDSYEFADLKRNQLNNYNGAFT